MLELTVTVEGGTTTLGIIRLPSVLLSVMDCPIVSSIKPGWPMSLEWARMVSSSLSALYEASRMFTVSATLMGDMVFGL